MKNTSIIAAIPLISMIFLALISYGLFRVIRLVDVQRRAVHEAEISIQMSLFGTENYHTQLEFYEYAYNPGDERLIAFNKHNQELSNKMDKLMTLIEVNKNSLYEGGEGKVVEMDKDLKSIQEDWKGVLTVISDFRAAKNSTEMVKVKELYLNLQERIAENENMFDSIAFNERVDDFVNRQDEQLLKSNKEISGLCSEIKLIAIIMVGLYMILLVLIAIWLDMTIRDLKRLRLKNNKI